MRISIIGYSGSGKTTLAKAISKKLSMPHLHLDRLWISLDGHIVDPHDASQKEKVSENIKEKVIEFIAQESWVTDGWYYRSQVEIAKRATVIIYLDIPLWRRLINHVGRTFTPSHRHPEFSTADNFKFIYELVKRTWTHKQKMNAMIDQYKDKVIILKSRKEISKYLSTINENS